MSKRRWNRLDFSPLELGGVVIASMLLFRMIAVLCMRAAANYTAKGDERQAARFSRLARQFARMSYMYGELEQETEVPPKN